jgi:hypothetical protein
VRKVDRPSPWKKALDAGVAQHAADVLHGPSGSVSLWQIGNDRDLRRVAIAMNERRDSLHEQLDLLPILPQELEDSGIAARETPGASRCPEAGRLHFDAAVSDKQNVELCKRLIQAGRQLGRCSVGRMKQAEERSRLEGCFAVVVTSQGCDCGAKRTP